jgi:hypothetical protein
VSGEPAPDGASPPVCVHGTAIVVGEAGVLIRGVSGAGKSSLALALVDAAGARGLFARLVGDDRIVLQCADGRLIARPHAAIAGQVERRGQGIGEVRHEGAAVLRCLVDIGPGMGEPGAPGRIPALGAHAAALEGVDLPRLAIPAGLGAAEAARLVMDYLTRRPGL